MPDALVKSNNELICYKYNKPIRSTVLNYNKLVTELDIETTIPDSWEYKEYKNCYQTAGHIITGDSKILFIQEFGLLNVKDLNTRFLHR